MSAEDPKNLEELRQRFGLTKLNLIKTYPNLLVFGARANDRGAIDWRGFERELAALAGKNSDEVKVAQSAVEEVEILIQEIAPYLAADGGGAGVVSADEVTGKVILALHGACSGCPSSIMTLKVGIERLLQEALPWVKDVESDQPPVEPDFGFHLGGNQKDRKENGADEGTPGSD